MEGTGRKTAAGPGPRIRSLESGPFAPPMAPRQSPASPATKDGLIESAGLIRRLQALLGALGDLPRQAKRLVRAQARRSRSPRLRWQSVLRPGPPPGWRRKPTHEIHDIVRRCHERAHYSIQTRAARARRDSS